MKDNYKLSTILESGVTLLKEYRSTMDDFKVSIIIRTCGRPLILKNALDSICRQTYHDIETIVIEDGKNVSQDFVQTFMPLLDIKYYATGHSVGRCCAGNLGLERATGDYMNFLDDDDRLLPNHVELLVNEIKKTGCKAAYSIAEEHQIVKKKAPCNKVCIKRKLIRYKQPYNRLLLFYMNYIPIQSILFSRELYEQYGGFDEQLNVLEDWDLWVRYSVHGEFRYVPQVTSVYYTPYKSRAKSMRDTQLKKETDKVMRKHQHYQVTTNVQQINQEMDYILNVFNKKGFLFYMQKIRNYLLYRDR